VKFPPRPFQIASANHAEAFLRSAKAADRRLYAAPTGVGKSVVERLVQERMGSGCWIVSPREEIIAGIMDKAELTGDPMQHSMTTPIVLRNRLLEGAIRHPEYLIIDESHHHNAETYQQLDLLTGLAPTVGYTATPYRGTPKGTKEFLDRWGEPKWLITYVQAQAEGYISMPKFSVLPLVDDDVVDVRGGEFEVTSINAATVDRLGDMAEHCRQWYTDKWDRPTIIAMPSTASCIRMQRELGERGIPAAIVSGETPRAQRYAIFQAVEAGLMALLHINVVAEGVDLKLRRLIDMAPTLSPVKWLQHLGRITRPTDEPPEYICTNRNILRHAYILEGVLPPAAMLEAQAAFPQSDRPGVSRVLGLEAIGRFKPVPVKLLSGLTAHVYAISVPVGPLVVEYCVLVHPGREAIWATKINGRNYDGTRNWGSWRACSAPSDVTGFSSVAPKTLSVKQLAWWKRSAARFGLKPDQEVTRKNFQALPVLADLGNRL
jgi:hypothetical protein